MKSAAEYHWKHYPEYGCWGLEDVLFCENPAAPQLQYLNIYAPEEYFHPDGTLNPSGSKNGFTATIAPIVYENGIGGYMESKPDVIGKGFNGWKMPAHLDRGFVYVAPGSRGRQTKGEDGSYIGRAPHAIVDLKAGVRYLRANRAFLPGNTERIFSIGFSAGGAFSALLGASGDHPAYLPYLEQIGACMNESDRVYAAQCYVPVMDLDHADMAYEWEFKGFDTYKGSMAMPGGKLSPFQLAVSEKLADLYPDYLASLDIGITDGEELRSCLLEEVKKAAVKHFAMIKSGAFPNVSSMEAYMQGDYSYTRFNPMLIKVMQKPGVPHTDWLKLENGEAVLPDLKFVFTHYRQRGKNCPGFDKLDLHSYENEEFSSEHTESVHFCTAMPQILEEIKDQFPEEYAQYAESYRAAEKDASLSEKKRLMNAMTMLSEGESHPADHFRIRMGAMDPETAYAVPYTFYRKLCKQGIDADYALVWDASHEPEDCGTELYDWIRDLS